MSEPERKLEYSLKKDVERKQKAEKEKRTLLAQTIFLGSIGIMLSLPVIIGAYVGRWLDEKLQGYSFSWTISLILIGVFVGALNVYLFLREND